MLKLLFFSTRHEWVNAIENVKRKLEDGEAIETDEANDPSNPFSKRGETKKRTGKSKVVSRIAEHLFWITYPTR